MKFTVTNRLRYIIFGLGGLAVLNLTLVDNSIRSLNRDSELIHTASSIRGQSQRMIKWHLFKEHDKAHADELEERDNATEKDIDEMMLALRNGDEKRRIPKATDPTLIAKINEMDAAWKEYKRVMVIADANPKLNGELMAVSERFFQLADEATNIAEDIADKSVQQGRIQIWTYSLLSILALAAGWFLVEKVVKKLSGSTRNLASTSTQIAAEMEQQERYLSEQAASVNQTTTTMEELGASSRQAAEQADASATGAQQALSISSDGSKIVSQTIAGISELQQKVEAIAMKIMELSEKTGQISGISDLVADLANQTNMLSLNAAVEAARAGEQGKGFAVVAGEVRKLAEQSKKSADKINALVVEVQSSINSTVMVTDEGTKTAQAGIRMAEDTASAFNGIAIAINDVYLNSQQIALSAKQQAVAVQQAISAMNVINIGAQETATGVTQVKASTQDLADTAKELQAIV